MSRSRQLNLAVSVLGKYPRSHVYLRGKGSFVRMLVCTICSFSMTVDPHVLQVTLHSDKYLTRGIDLRLKCVIWSHVSFYFSLDKFLVFPLQKWLLTVPKVSKLILLGATGWASHLYLFVSRMRVSSSILFRLGASSGWSCTFLARTCKSLLGIF